MSNEHVKRLTEHLETAMHTMAAQQQEIERLRCELDGAWYAVVMQAAYIDRLRYGASPSVTIPENPQ